MRKKGPDLPLAGAKLLRSEDLAWIAMVSMNDRVNLAWEHYEYYDNFIELR